ncbi:uncharacterized protein Tco025E_08963 [Trypanosoma conorhini]|uniref:Uncharacterized protein n=1 Tax=Trypanosoma conorhini TaxID=83891 RepID=A0A422N2G4_9TRYP|nr:uncharacterized protein Tco025E_08963 [Trypanosoma conorhini]RNE99662.1 hypothetical protein Tco025E_08963 [Trypanosoma conorhini]
MPVSPQYRLFQQRHYLDYSERDAGASHLWHAHRLAEARLRPGKGITDAPEVDFRHPELMDREQSKACAVMTRLQRRVVDEEQRVVRGNKNLLGRLLDVNDAEYRERRGMNNRPTEDELRRWYRVEEQAQVRRRDRARQEVAKRRQNLIVMQHLIEARPSVATAKQLDQWHEQEHKNRVRQLRRFRRAEPFAGANLLRTGCGVRLAERRTDCVEARTAALKPLLWREHKVPTLMDTLNSGTLLPSLEEASKNYAQGNLTLNAADDFAWAWTQPLRRREKKPAWKNITALDAKLMNYASDVALARGGDLPIVRREEENGVTRLWREGLERSHRARTAGRPDATAAEGGAGAAAPGEGFKSAVGWDADRWRSRTSVFTWLRSRSSRSSQRRSTTPPIEGWAAFSSLGDAREQPPARAPSASIRLKEHEVSFSGSPNREANPFSFAFAKLDGGDDVSSEQAYKALAKLGGGDDVSSEQAHEAPAKLDGGDDVSSEQAHKAPAKLGGGDDVSSEQAYKAPVKLGGGDDVSSEQAYKAPVKLDGDDAANSEQAYKATAAADQGLEKALRGRRSLAEWAAELRCSQTPFVPY